MSDELVERLAVAIKGLKLWTKFGSMAEVGAFALCTDSSLSNLLACAAPRKWLDENAERAFWPPDWPLEDDDDELMYSPGAILEQRYRDALKRAAPDSPGKQDISQHVARSFSHFVEALERLRSESFFAKQTILLISGTTPDARMFAKSTEAVARLNDEDVVARWKDFWPQHFGAVPVT
jgi:hypothetical protein